MTLSPATTSSSTASSSRARTVARDRLWQRFHTGCCQNAREQLIELYGPLVSITARRFGPSLHGSLERDDLVGIGYTGLIKAVDQFDPARGIAFETFAITLIRGAILESLRNENWMPRSVRDQKKAYQAAEIRLDARLGRSAGETELAAELHVSEEKLAAMRALIARGNPVALDKPCPSDGSDAVRSLADLLADEGPSPGQQAETAEVREALCKAVSRLPERERHVILRYYANGQTFKEIGGALKVSESRAYQLHGQALRRLRGSLKGQEV